MKINQSMTKILMMSSTQMKNHKTKKRQMISIHKNKQMRMKTLNQRQLEEKI